MGKMEEGEEEKEEEEEEDTCLAVGIDSLTMLLHRLRGGGNEKGKRRGGVRPILQVLQALRRLAGLTPIIAVLHHQDHINSLDRAALEDFATTNIYIYPSSSLNNSSVGSEGSSSTTGRCFVVRKSASGKVHEEWDNYIISCQQGSNEEIIVRFNPETASSRVAEGELVDKGDAAAEGTGRRSKKTQKEEAFLESLSFKLTLNDQERDMRGQTVLPHARQQTLSGEGLPLIYHEAEALDDDEEIEDDEEDDFDDDIDDDLDL